MKTNPAILALTFGMIACFIGQVSAQESLPFPPTPSASTAGLTIDDSMHKKRVTPSRLQPGAPNVLIILIDDVGPGVASTYGGEVHTPTIVSPALGLALGLISNSTLRADTPGEAKAIAREAWR